MDLENVLEKPESDEDTDGTMIAEPWNGNTAKPNEEEVDASIIRTRDYAFTHGNISVSDKKKHGTYYNYIVTQKPEDEPERSDFISLQSSNSEVNGIEPLDLLNILEHHLRCKLIYGSAKEYEIKALHEIEDAIYAYHNK
jgi:hypothetical protein